MSIMQEEFKAWGETFHFGIPHASDYGCQNPDCRWDMILEESNYSSYAVGFSLENPRVSLLPQRRDIIGVLIFECPKCFNKFWVHCSESWYDTIMRQKKAANK